MSIKFCPYCGSIKIKFFGISGIGDMYRCKECFEKFIIAVYEEYEQS